MASVDLQAAPALSPASVYAALTDLKRRPQLDPTITEIAPPEDAVEGAAFSGAGTLSGSLEAFEGVITALEPDRFVGLLFRYGNGARLVEQWTLRPTPSGTLITYHAELTMPGGVLGKLLDVLFVGGGFRKQREAVLAQLKVRVENQP